MSWQGPNRRRQAVEQQSNNLQSTIINFSNPLVSSLLPPPIGSTVVSCPPSEDLAAGLRYRGTDSGIATPSRESSITVESYENCAQIPHSQSLPSLTPEPSIFGKTDAPLATDTMPCRERTAEFRTTAKGMQMKQAAVNGHANRSSKQQLVQSSVQFNNLARRIGRDVSQTCAKLEKLAALAKRKSLFDDRVSEVEELSGIVKQDITGLNKQIAQLQSIVQGAHSGKQGENHSRSVVVGLQSRLAAVSTTFKTVLETRTQNMKDQKTRRDQFGQSQAVPSSLPPSASTGIMGSVLLADEAQANGSVSLDMERMQQQVALIDQSESYVQARGNAMETVESSIVELGQIFRQLAHLVSEQGETIQRIDHNVEETSINVEAAHHELLRYFRNISRNRWLAIKVFGVLIVFFIIFIIFMT